MSGHVIPREIPHPSELGRPVHPGENGELMGHLAEIAALCSRLQSDVGAAAEPEDIFESALPVLRRLVDFRAMALFTVEEGGVDFALTGVDPEEEGAALERELALQVEEGTFTWALYRNHAVIVPALGRRGRVLMHALSTSSGVRGMFFGVLPARATYIPEVTRELISVVLFTSAGVLESGALNRRLTNYSEELEATVRTRTRALRSSEEEAREANRVKSEFLAHTSHEIRAPINGIIGTLSLLDRTPLAGEQRAYVETIDRSARVLLRLAGDVLDLSRIEAGRMEVDRAAMPLREVVDGAVELVSARALERGLDLWVQWDRRLPVRMVGDAGRVRQILTNLLDNAVKFTPSGEVCVDCALRGEGDAQSVVVQVRDTGPGVAGRDRERIFQRFSQGGTKGGTGDLGSGLGLAIARDLARIMGGDLVLEPGGGTGSAFTLVLPVTLPEAPEAPGGTARRALLVTRDRRLAGCVEEDVSWLGGELGVLDSLDAAAVYLAGDDAPPTLLVDRTLATVEQIRRTLPPSAPVVLLAEPGARREAGGVPVLVRPWTSRRLREALGWSQAEAGAAAATPGSVTGSGDFAGTRVLVVDDDEVTRTVLGWILAELGCAHAAVPDGEEALARVAEGGLDVVLMDSRLPDLSGEETTRRIREMERRTGEHPVRIIGVTGRAGAEARRELMTAGMEEVLVKPVTLEVISRALGRSESGPGARPLEERLAAAGVAALADVWPERRERIREAQQDGNLGALAQEAHRMKGAGALVGAHEVADASAALEMAGRTGNRSRAAHLVPELESVVEAFLEGAVP
jgi:signal transduction histidine kinase/CheY-like chemotaxis protein